MRRKGGTRPGAGPPRRLDGGCRVTVYLDADALARLDLICHNLGFTRSAAMRYALTHVRQPKPRSKPND